MSDTFFCQMCKQTFDKGWSDEEALEEARRDRPEFQNLSQGLCCDDCHEEYQKWFNGLSEAERKKMYQEAVEDELLR